MADVIGRQQKSSGAVRIFAPEHPNTRDTAEQQSHQQFTSAIGRRSALPCLGVSLTRHRKGYFKADSFFERGIIVGSSHTRFCYETQESFDGR